MTEERIALVEKYLGNREKPGLLKAAWRELRDALDAYHASLTLEHISHEARLKRLEDASEAFAQTLFNMQVELYAPTTPEPQEEPKIFDPGEALEALAEAYQELGGEG